MTYVAPVAERVAGFSAADLTWVLVIVCVGLVIGKRDPIPYALETDWPVGAEGIRTSAYPNKTPPAVSEPPPSGDEIKAFISCESPGQPGVRKFANGSA